MSVMEQAYILHFGAMWFATWGTLISYNRLSNPTPRVPVLDRPRYPKCAKCGEQLFAPEGSEYVADLRVRHLWECEECGYAFETSVSYEAVAV
jgi:DNA-directed RNA polymerase subunit RPC12/RpoP